MTKILLLYMKASVLPARWTLFIKTLCLLSNFKYLLELRNTVNPIGLEGLKLHMWLSIFLREYFPLLRNVSRRAFPTSCKGIGRSHSFPREEDGASLTAKASHLWEECSYAHPKLVSIILVRLLLYSFETRPKQSI